MKISDVFRINIKKLKFRSGKAAFLIIPIAVLVLLSIVISSQVTNFKDVAADSIFGELEDESTLLEVEYQQEQGERGFGFLQDSSNFTGSDVEDILALDHVDSAVLNYTLPIDLARSSDLFEDKEISISNISVISEELAVMYTDEDFSYTEGEEIPIIINDSNFSYSYEDWEGEDEWVIEMDFESMRDMRDFSGGRPSEEDQEDMESAREEMESQTPLKTEILDYDEDDLIGHVFTVTFGGFDDISDVSTERSESAVTYTKLTDEEVQNEYNERKATIDEYWDYDELEQGITYTFRVVGVVDSKDTRYSYVPEDFAYQLMEEYYSLQLDSLNLEPDTDDLNSVFMGSTYDGTELSSSNSTMGGFGGNMGGGMGMARPDDSSDEDTESYTISGLVIEAEDGFMAEAEGIYLENDAFTESVKTGTVITLKVDDVKNRTGVIEAINDLGYSYRDSSGLSVFSEIQKTLNKVSSWLIVGFIVISTAVIILTMSKFVSESTKEIGIFRAVGFKKLDILVLFLAQAVMYTGVGYAAGSVLGYIINLLVSPLMGSWFDKFTANTVGETVEVLGEIDYSAFRNIDISSFLLFSGILAVITIVIALIPSYTASRVSPVEAIKNE